MSKKEKTFTVVFSYTVTVQTVARNEEEAIVKASDEAQSSAGGWETNEIQVTEESA